MNCLQCRHWQLDGSPLRAYGYGMCQTIQEPARRAGQTFAPNNQCRLGKFAQAPAAVIADRAKEGSTIL